MIKNDDFLPFCVFFFSRTPLRTPPGVRNQRGGVRNKSKSGVRNGVRNNFRNPKSMVESQKLSKLSYGI